MLSTSNTGCKWNVCSLSALHGIADVENLGNSSDGTSSGLSCRLYKIMGVAVTTGFTVGGKGG